MKRIVSILAGLIQILACTTFLRADLLEPGLPTVEYTCKLDNPTPSCPAATSATKLFSIDATSVLAGNASLHYKGTNASRSVRQLFRVTVPVSANTLYEINLKLRHTNRSCYNYLANNYQSANKYVSDLLGSLSSNDGIWCGDYSVQLTDNTQSTVRTATLSNTMSHDSPYVRTENLEWFPLSNTFRTGNKAGTVMIQFDVRGFDGEIFFDDLTVDPVTNLADESNLKVPIQGEPFGMKFTNIKAGDVSVIETSQARFEFDGINGDKNLIKVFKKQPNGLIPLTTLTLPINTLQGHTIETDVPGVVIVRSNGFTWSVGADSSILARSLTANSVHIGALENASDNRYSVFQAGVAFDADLTNKYGFVFAPVHGLNTKRLINTTNPLGSAYVSDAEAEKAGVNNYTISGLQNGSLSAHWDATYNFLSGEYFLLSVFPPREHKDRSQCKLNLSVPSYNPVIHTETQVKGALDALAVDHQIAFLYMGYYDSVNNSSTEPKLFYYVDRKLQTVNGKVTFVSPEVLIAPPATPVPTCNLINEGPCQIEIKVKRDVAGHNYIADENLQKIRNFNDYAHAKNLRTVAYLAPNFRYSTDVDLFLENVSRIVNDYGIDGVYYDGTMPASPLANFKIARMTRNMLGSEKLFIQHSSSDLSFNKHNEKYRIPVFDAYSDLIFLSEHRFSALDHEKGSNTCSPLWGMMYAGVGLSNAPAMITRELRYTKNSLGEFEPLSADEVIDTQLNCGGLVYMPPRNLPASINFYGLGSDFSTTNTASYYDRLNVVCQEPPPPPDNTITPTPSPTPTPIQVLDLMCRELKPVISALRNLEKKVSQYKASHTAKQEHALLGSLKHMRLILKKYSVCNSTQIAGFPNSRKVFSKFSSRNSSKLKLSQATKIIKRIKRELLKRA